MIVEDDEILRELYLETISLAGMEVIASLDNGASAVEMIKSGSAVDLIIMDHRMPGMSGLQAIKEIRRIRPDISVIFATADDVEDSVLTGRNVVVLLKPFGMEQLINAVKRLRK